MRQLYQACVIPKMDYASTVWYRHGRVWQVAMLRKIQRIAATRIISAFRTVATETLEVEANLVPTHLRLQQRAFEVLAGLRALPVDHPIWPVDHRQEAAPRRNQSRSPLAITAAHFDEKWPTLHTETINLRTRAPWRRSAFKSIRTECDRAEARKLTTSLMAADPKAVIYTDGSGIDNQLGAATVILDAGQGVYRRKRLGVGSSRDSNVYVAELIAIQQAVLMADDDQSQADTAGHPPPKDVYRRLQVRPCTLLRCTHVLGQQVKKLIMGLTSFGQTACVDQPPAI